MTAKMTKQHSPKIIEKQLNGKSEEQYIKDVQNVIVENINGLFYTSGLTLRQFALQVGISHSSLARITENRKGKGKVTLNTICKIGANLGVPIQDLFTCTKKLPSIQKKNKCSEKEKETSNLSGQMDIFDFLKNIEEKRE